MAVVRLEQETFTQAYHALGTNKGHPMLSPIDLVASAPVEGMIPAARPGDQVTPACTLLHPFPRINLTLLSCDINRQL